MKICNIKEYIFVIFFVINKFSRVWVICNCVCFLDIMNFGKVWVIVVIFDDGVIMWVCKFNVVLICVIVYEINVFF